MLIQVIFLHKKVVRKLKKKKKTLNYTINSLRALTQFFFFYFFYINDIFYFLRRKF